MFTLQAEGAVLHTPASRNYRESLQRCSRNSRERKVRAPARRRDYIHERDYLRLDRRELAFCRLDLGLRQYAGRSGAAIDSILTGAVPRSAISSLSAARFDTSICRPFV